VTQVRANGVPGWNGISRPLLSAGFVSELLHRDDPDEARTGDRGSAHGWAVRVAAGLRDVARLRGLPRPGQGGVVPAGPERQTVAGWRICSGWAALADGPGCCRAAGDPLGGHGDHSLERGIEHPFASVDFLAQVPDQRRERGCVARLDPGDNAARLRISVRHLLIAARMATWEDDAQAPKREQASVRAGGISDDPR
jgi:hypothetical protein